MGLFDTVYVDAKLAAGWLPRCSTCGRPAASGGAWQTKSLNPCMYSYFLRHDDAGAIRLYLLDRPSNRRFWRAWTDEEIAESEKEAERGGLFALWRKKLGDGHYLPEAYLPEHRRQRFMGELPHQWVEIHGACSCGAYPQFWIKFSDGVATEVRSDAPTPGQGFFDEAGELGD